MQIAHTILTRLLDLRFISTGEEIVEPEVDLSGFLSRQKLSPDPSSAPPPDEDEDVDKTLSHLYNRPSFQSKKGRVVQVEWTEELEEMSREKAAADATRGKIPQPSF